MLNVSCSKPDPRAARPRSSLPSATRHLFNEVEAQVPLAPTSAGPTEEVWTGPEVDLLHFILLDSCALLADPQAPLEDKLDVLRWIYTEPDKDDRPFSFAHCLQFFGRATNPSQGTLDVDEVRAALWPQIKDWLRQTLERYPTWVRDAFWTNPVYVAELLEKNPQRLNEAARAGVVQPDLFNPDGVAIGREP